LISLTGIIDVIVGIIQAIRAKRKRIKINWENLNEDFDFTIIIPVYNIIDKLDTVRKALKEIEMFKDRIVIVDDGSDDNTVEIIKEWGFRIIRNETNRKKIGAILSVLSQIKTQWIVLMDSDSYPQSSQLLPKLISFLRQRQIDACAVKVLPIPRDKWFIEFQKMEYSLAMFLKNFLQRRVVCISGAFGVFRKDVLEKITKEQSLKWEGEDLERTLRILEKGGRIIYIPDFVVLTKCPETLIDLVKQRIIWAHGLIRCSLKFWKLAFSREALGVYLLYNLVMNVICHPFKLLSLPLLFIFPQSFLFLYIIYLLLVIFISKRVKEKVKTRTLLMFPFYSLFLVIVPTTLGYCRAILHYLKESSLRFFLFGNNNLALFLISQRSCFVFQIKPASKSASDSI